MNHEDSYYEIFSNTSSLLGPNILISFMFSNTESMCWSEWSLIISLVPVFK
jgi:hypothetical protein